MTASGPQPPTIASGVCKVSSAVTLAAAIADLTVSSIEVEGIVEGAASVRLAPGRRLVSKGGGIRFAAGQDGVELTSDNAVEGLSLATDLGRRALFNDQSVTSLGTISISNLSITGCVRLIASGSILSGHVAVNGLALVAADARAFNERPSGFGVEVVPGAFTLWNQHRDPSVLITAELLQISAGRAAAPVRGSGVFVAGGGDGGGRLEITTLETGEIHSNGGIAVGTADRISGGVFTLGGAIVDVVRNTGTVTTYGPNDMVLDNWGSVDTWVANEAITSFGPSGIGFVNFGTLKRLRILGPIETHGQGARGFNVYAGLLGDAEFDRIVTHGDGAVGVQISQPVDSLVVKRGIETNGGIGDSLVKGVVLQLPATPLSIKPGGSAISIKITGGVVANGPGVAPIEMHGMIQELRISDGFTASGGGFDGI